MSSSRPKVAITDWTFPDLDVERAILEPLGISIDARQCKTEEELSALVRDADCVITQFARLNATVIRVMTRAQAIVRYGIGVDNVDIETARSSGIPVCNVPDYCLDEVADHTLALILGLTRQVVPHAVSVRHAQWRLAVPLNQMRALQDLTVAVIGFGRIGREVIRRLHSFKCRLLACDPNVPASAMKDAGTEPVSFAEALVTADLITLHCPSNSQTRNLINHATLMQMKRGSMLVNVARGDLVDTPALTEALLAGHLAAAAFDVFNPEPIPPEHPLLKMPNVIFSPHIASVSPAAVAKLRQTVAETAAAAVRGEPLPNIVNGVSYVRSTS